MNYDEILASELGKEADKQKEYARKKQTSELVRILGTASYLMDVRNVQAYKAVLRERGIKGIPE